MTQDANGLTEIRLASGATLKAKSVILSTGAMLQKKLYSLPNVTVILNALTTKVRGDGEKVNGLVYKDRASNELHTVELEGIFVQIGLLPNTDWLKGTLGLSPRGEIEVDARGQTSLPGAFAASLSFGVLMKALCLADAGRISFEPAVAVGVG